MNHFIGISIMLLTPMVYYLVVYVSYAESLKNKLNFEKKEIAITGIVLVAFMLFSYVVMKQDRFIYYWDYGREWRLSLFVRNGLINNPLAEIKDIYNTVNNTDYNKLMPLLMAFPLYIKDSFKGYVWIMEGLYLCPTFVYTAILIKKIIANVLDMKIPLYICLIITICNPIIYYITFYGFMGGCILLLVVSIISLSLDMDYSVINTKKDILLSLLLTTLVLSRRYFAYYAVGFIISQLITAIIQLFEERKGKIILVKNYVINMFIIGLPALCFLIILFRGFLVRSIFNNYSSSYSAYDASLYLKLNTILIVFGWIVIIGGLVLSAFAAFNNRKCLRIVLPLYINTIMPVVLMSRILQMNYHHFSVIIIQVIILYTIGMCWFVKKIAKNKATLKCAAVLVSIGLLNMSATFLPCMKNLNDAHLLTGYKYEPKRRNDIEEIERIVADMNRIYSYDNKASFYILASNGILNSQIIEYANCPNPISDVHNLFGTHDVDLVGGFPSSFLEATYVLTSDPIQTHLPDGTQTVITYLAEEIQDDSSTLGSHYTCVSEYLLDDDVVAKLYKLTSPLGNNVYNDLYEYYNGRYPDEKAMFADRIKLFVPTIVGEKTSISFIDGVLSSQCADENGVSTKEGFLVYGPYKKVGKGNYKITFHLENVAEPDKENEYGYVDICSDGIIIDKQLIHADDLDTVIDPLRFVKDYSNVEFRVYVVKPGIKFNGIELEKIMD